MIHTRYENLNNNELADLFHSSNWSKLSSDDRLAACQEVANRDALAHGMTPCEVVPSGYTGTLFGEYDPSDGKIHVNESVLNNGTIIDGKGNEIAYPGSAAETLNTVFHENSHAYDAQLAEAVSDKQNGFDYNSEIIADAEKRGIDIDTLRASDTVYISSGSNPDAYRVQDSEKRAYDNGDKKTAEMLSGAEARLGKDEEFAAYTERLEDQDSYKTSLENLKTVYNDENFDKTMNEQTKDIFFSDHKEDKDFQYGTPESRNGARTMLESTPGARLVDFNENLGITNEHYTGDRNENADGAAGNTGIGANGAKGADESGSVSASLGGSAESGEQNAGGSTNAGDANTDAGGGAASDGASKDSDSDGDDDSDADS